MERRTERERERTSEGREGRKGEREGLISSSLSNETIGEELPPVWRGPKAVGTRKTRGKKVGRREAGTIQALADSHTVSSGKDREFWIQQKRLPLSLPLAYSFGGLHAAFLRGGNIPLLSTHHTFVSFETRNFFGDP